MKGKVVLIALLFVCIFSGFVLANGSSESEKVKVAFIAPFTGGNAVQGINGRNGFQMAINEANASGEFPYVIELMALDDGSVPEQGVTAAHKACADMEVVAAAGHFNSPVALATTPVFHEKGVSMMIWSAIHPDITEVNGAKWPEITRICVTLPSETSAFFDWVVDDLGYSNFALITNTSSYGESCGKYFVQEAEKRGVTIASHDEINSGDTDFMAILTKIGGLKPRPQAIYFGGVVAEGAILRQQMVRAGLDDMLFCALSGLDSDRFNTLGKDAEGVVVVGKGRQEGDSSKWDNFVSKYEAAGYEEDISVRTAYGYDAANIILQALKDVGPDREAMVTAIRNISHDGINGTYTFDNNGQTTLVTASNIVNQDGEWLLYSESEYAAGLRTLPKSQ